MDAVICGIDPGLERTGYAVVRSNGRMSTIIEAGVCRLEAETPLAERLLPLQRDVVELLREHRPRFVAVEELYSHYKHPRTAVLMGHARGVILLCAAQAEIPVRSYAATRVKRHLTGNGRASKEQVQQAIRTTLGLSALPEPADVADALAIALCCAAEVGHRAMAEYSA